MAITLTHVRKSYGGRPVLRDLSLTVEDGAALCLTGPSGRGKTTLLRLLLGLEQPDSGQITGLTTASALFQEDRLLEAFTPLDNLRFVLGRRTEEELEALLCPLLPRSCLRQPASELSGGMKRRLALVRALAAPSRLLVLDEPFTGLDEDNRRAAVEFLQARRGGRTLVLATHHREDAVDLDAPIRNLDELDSGSQFP